MRTGITFVKYLLYTQNTIDNYYKYNNATIVFIKMEQFRKEMIHKVSELQNM
jgi:hypothetical protein